ncbi:MAG: substrate-binding domain-containing protein [Clostridia bacterium]|nr:substrate-binding domain-containing protein [Clostridia bacterium]
MNRDNRKVTIKDIAQRLGCSLSTVNKALTGKSGVSEKRRREIQNAALEMGYEVNTVAQIMSRNPITIGVVIPDGNDRRYANHFVALKKGMDREFAHLEKYRIHPAYYLLSDDPMCLDKERFSDWLTENEVEAVCYCPNFFADEKIFIETTLEHRLPLFLCGGGMVPPEECVTTFSVNSVHSGKIAADFFHCVYGDDVRAAVTIESYDTVSQRERVDAFCNRLHEYGIENVVVKESHLTQWDSEAMMKELFDSGADINCLYIATGLYEPVGRYIEEHGLVGKVTQIATDLTDAVAHGMKTGAVQAFFLQNQQDIGRRTVRNIYDYLVRKRTFGNDDWQPPKRVYLAPRFCLKADLESLNEE